MADHPFISQFESPWDRMPVWLRIIAVVGFIIYFGGGLLAPLFWFIE